MKSILYKKISKIRNLREINQKTQNSQSYKRGKSRRNPYHPPLKCHLINSATFNFRTTYSKLFSHPSVQLKECLRWSPQAVNVPLKKLILNPKFKVTRRVTDYCRKDCYIQIKCHKRNFIGTYIKSSLDHNLWIRINLDMRI